MNILHGTCREVVVYHQVDTFEIDSTSHKSRADEHPDFTSTEAANYIISLKEKKAQTSHVSCCILRVVYNMLFWGFKAISAENRYSILDMVYNIKKIYIKIHLQDLKIVF